MNWATVFWSEGSRLARGGYFFPCCYVLLLVSAGDAARAVLCFWKLLVSLWVWVLGLIGALGWVDCFIWWLGLFHVSS